MTSTEYRRSSGLRRRARWIALFGVCLFAFGAAAAIGAIVDGGDGVRELREHEGARKDWQLAAQTTDARFGEVEFYRAMVAGSECFGYRLVEQDRPTGTTTIYHSCGDAAETLDVGWLRKEGGGPTLAHGWVSEEVDAVVLRVAGRPDRQLPLTEAGNGVRGRFFAASDPGALKAATIEALGKDGEKKASESSAPPGL